MPRRPWEAGDTPAGLMLAAGAAPLVLTGSPASSWALRSAPRARLEGPVCTAHSHGRGSGGGMARGLEELSRPVCSSWTAARLEAEAAVVRVPAKVGVSRRFIYHTPEAEWPGWAPSHAVEQMDLPTFLKRARCARRRFYGFTVLARPRRPLCGFVREERCDVWGWGYLGGLAPPSRGASTSRSR